MLERLRKAGAPLNGLGIQAHLDLGKGPLSSASLAGFLAEVAALDLDIVITELDVKEFDYTRSAAERDQAVADLVRRYLDAALQERAVKGVVCWGLSDRQSWLTVTDQGPGALPGGVG